MSVRHAQNRKARTQVCLGCGRRIQVRAAILFAPGAAVLKEHKGNGQSYNGMCDGYKR